MSIITQPMLAATMESAEDISYPCYCTPKLDGIRVLKIDGKVLTRKFIEIPNRHIRKVLEENLPNNIDGEIMPASGDFEKIQGDLSRFDGEPDFIYNAFDYVSPFTNCLEKPYISRIADLESWYKSQKDKLTCKVKLILPVKVKNSEELKEFHKKCVSEGYEGVMIRHANGPYKCGRSTNKEGYLIKYKTFLDDEAEIIGFEEKMSNKNTAGKNAFGRTKRSSAKAGLVAANTLGSLIVNWKSKNQIFNLGSGFNDAQKLEIWNNQEKYLGKILKFQYQKVGSKGKPIFPSFISFREDFDI